MSTGDQHFPRESFVKASNSGSQGCVGVSIQDHGIAVRDEKHPDGPMLRFNAFEWDTFIGAVKRGEFDRH
jgi:hypothetical protein